MASEAGFSEAKERALEYETYEDYLNSQITERDVYYLEVRALVDVATLSLPSLFSSWSV